jgi:hypothetical protein
MFKRIILLTLPVLLCASTSFAGGREEIESMCVENWGSDHQMRDACIENQQNAAELWLQNYFSKYVAAFIAAEDKDPESTFMMEEATTVYECAKQFTDSAGRLNYLLVLKCCDDKFQAYNTAKQ